MKKILVAILATSTLISTGASAVRCSPEQEYIAAIMLFSGISSITGTTMLSMCDGRAQEAVLQSDVAHYKLSGNKSVSLQEALASLTKETGLTDSEILAKLTAQ